MSQGVLKGRRLFAELSGGMVLPPDQLPKVRGCLWPGFSSKC